MTLPTIIYTPPDWLSPFEWRHVFGREGRVEIEIGAGNGTFLLWAAANAPATNFLGVERLLGRLRRIDSKATRRELPNVRLLRLEAGYFVQYLVPRQSVAVYHVYFPDPWPKRRHQAQRLFSPLFIEQVHATLVPGGEIRVATDDADYFASIEKLMRSAGVFEPVPVEPAAAGVATDFERKWTAAGRAIQRAWWRKRA